MNLTQIFDNFDLKYEIVGLENLMHVRLIIFSFFFIDVYGNNKAGVKNEVGSKRKTGKSVK